MIYLLRHGQTELNKQNLMQGQCDHPLNEQGRLQARNAGKVIRDSGLKFDRVFSSPLRRAVETGEIALCVSGEEFILDDRLMEMSYGPYEETDVKELTLFAMNFLKDPESYPAPEGIEGGLELRARLLEFARENLFAKDEENILVISHQIALRELLCVLMGLSWRDLKGHWLSNCDICEVKGADGKNPVPVRILGRDEKHDTNFSL